MESLRGLNKAVHTGLSSNDCARYWHGIVSFAEHEPLRGTNRNRREFWLWECCQVALKRKICNRAVRQVFHTVRVINRCLVTASNKVFWTIATSIRSRSIKKWSCSSFTTHSFASRSHLVNWPFWVDIRAASSSLVCVAEVVAHHLVISGDFRAVNV